jgi:hypothetical protein
MRRRGLLRTRIGEIVLVIAARRSFTRDSFLLTTPFKIDPVVRLGDDIAREILMLILKQISFHDYEQAVNAIVTKFSRD